MSHTAEHKRKRYDLPWVVAVAEPEVGPLRNGDLTELVFDSSTLTTGSTSGIPPNGMPFATTRATAVTLDSAGNIYLAGYTDAINFPTIPGVAFNSYHQCCIAFLLRDVLLARIPELGMPSLENFGRIDRDLAIDYINQS